MATPTKEVLEVLKRNNISLDEFHSMMRTAAIITHGLGNRRFHGWVFEVKSGVCTKMSPWVKEVTVDSTVDMVAYDECEHCEGAGCAQCDFVGHLRVNYVRRQRSVENGKAKVRYR